MLWDFGDFSSLICEICGQVVDMDKMREKFLGIFYVFNLIIDFIDWVVKVIKILQY